MTTTLDEATGKLAAVVEQAAGGEDVLITVEGVPAAKLVAVAERTKPTVDRESWAAELDDLRARGAVEGAMATSQAYWDEARADRL